MWTEEILHQLELRDAIEKKDATYYKAFQQLRQILTATTSKYTNDDLENSDESSKPTPMMDHDKLIDRINALHLKIETLEDKLHDVNKLYKQSDKDNHHLKGKIRNLTLEIVEKNKAIETINDELLSCNIQNNVLTGQIQDLTKENQLLVERWLDRVRKDAEKLNDANEFLENLNMK